MALFDGCSRSRGVPTTASIAPPSTSHAAAMGSAAAHRVRTSPRPSRLVSRGVPPMVRESTLLQLPPLQVCSVRHLPRLLAPSSSHTAFFLACETAATTSCTDARAVASAGISSTGLTTLVATSARSLAVANAYGASTDPHSILPTCCTTPVRHANHGVRKRSCHTLDRWKRSAFIALFSASCSSRAASEPATPRTCHPPCGAAYIFRDANHQSAAATHRRGWWRRRNFIAARGHAVRDGARVGAVGARSWALVKSESGPRRAGRLMAAVRFRNEVSSVGFDCVCGLTCEHVSLDNASARAPVHGDSGARSDNPAAPIVACQLSGSAATWPRAFMSRFTLQYAGARVLREVARPVRRDQLRELSPLLAAMEQQVIADNAQGLCAQQLGESLRIMMMPASRASHSEDAAAAPFVAINPKILRRSQERHVDWEACLSIPNYAALVSRPAKVRVTYQTADGEDVQATLTGDRARIFQHEVDHMEGILYTARMVAPSFVHMDVFNDEQARDELEEAASTMWLSLKDDTRLSR